MHLLDEVRQAEQEKDWRWQRVGWVFMLLIVILELIGVFGGGVVADKSEERHVGDAEYRLTYQGWNRQFTASFLNVEVYAPEASGDTLKISFSDRMTTGWVLRSSNPGNDGSSADASGQVYEYKVDDWDQKIIVSFDYLPRETGIWSGRITVQAGASDPVTVPIEQKVFP